MQKRHFQNRVVREGDQFTLMVEVNGPGGMYAEAGRVYFVGKVPSELKDANEFCKGDAEGHVETPQTGADPGDLEGEQ